MKDMTAVLFTKVVGDMQTSSLLGAINIVYFFSSPCSYSVFQLLCIFMSSVSMPTAWLRLYSMTCGWIEVPMKCSKSLACRSQTPRI